MQREMARKTDHSEPISSDIATSGDDDGPYLIQLRVLTVAEAPGLVCYCVVSHI